MYDVYTKAKVMREEIGMSWVGFITQVFDRYRSTLPLFHILLISSLIARALENGR